MKPQIGPQRVSRLKEAYRGAWAWHDAERSAAMMEEMLVRGGKQLLESLSGEGK